MTIPNSVTSIGDGAFYGCRSLTNVAIPNSVTSIGEGAFYDCSSLTSVTIPNSVASISEYAFSRCESLTSVTIPNSVTSIGEYAFSGCSSLTSVTIPNSVTSIGEEAFSRCENLTSVTIPNSVTSIGEFAFYRCESLTSVTIPNSVASIGKGPFAACPLQEVVNFARDPQLILPSVFSGVQLDSVQLSVPSLSVEKYKNAAVWKDFGTIEGMVLPEFRFCSNNYYFETISIQLCGETEFTFPAADILMPYEGFDFAGWTTNADGTGKMFMPNQNVPLEELKGLFMFYAKWVDSAGIDAVETDKIVVSGGVLCNHASE